jgi:hypothetical protein
MLKAPFRILILSFIDKGTARKSRVISCNDAVFPGASGGAIASCNGGFFQPRMPGDKQERAVGIP